MLSLRSIRRRPVQGVLIVLILCIVGYSFQSILIPHTSLSFPGLDENDHRTLASRAVNNTVVIVPVNTGMLRWVENLLCSLKQTSFDISNLVFWTLDEEAQQALDRSGFATYYDPHLFNVPGDENHNGNTKAYNRMMKERPKFFIRILKTGFDVLSLDVDTVFWQSPLLFLPSPDDDNDIDAVFSTDAREFYQSHNAFEDAWRRGPYVPPVCNGIFWMRSNRKTIALWTRMLEIFNEKGLLGWYHRSRFQDDQRGMDVLLNDGRARLVPPFPEGITADIVPLPAKGSRDLTIRLLDQTSVVNGHLLKYHGMEYERNLGNLRARGQNRIAAHFNWDTTELTKEEGSKLFNMSFLNPDGLCKFGPILPGMYHG